ncbi:MAG: DUF4384 domain-containing protein [Nitrospirota bacterium]
MGMDIKRSIPLLIAVLFAAPAFAAHDEPVRVEAEGTILLGDDSTMGQAKAAALNNARRAALEKTTGVEVRGSSRVYNYQLINDLVVTATKGIIIKENVLRSSCTAKDDQVSCGAKIEAWVKPLHRERRGNFSVNKARVHRADKSDAPANPVFQNNDEIVIRASSNQDAWFSLFSVDQSGAVSKLYPNEYLKEERVPAGKEIIFPDEACRQGGVKLKVRTPRGRKKAVESVLIIATKEKQPFWRTGRTRTWPSRTS